MPRKGSRSLKLSTSLEAELERLVGSYLGNNRSEVITFILKEWLFSKREQLDRLGNAGNQDPNSGRKA